MHYLTLATVKVGNVHEEPDTDEIIRMQAEELKNKMEGTDKDIWKSVVSKMTLSHMQHLGTAFARRIYELVGKAMEPYWEQTENPDYLDFIDCTEEIQNEYGTVKEMVKLPEGRYIFPSEYEFRRRFTIRDGKVFEKDAGPCKHEMRTKKTKKMTVVIRKMTQQYKTVQDFADDCFGYQYYEETCKFGYYTNPRAFWDWYQIGGRWPGKFLVKADCKEYSIGERDMDTVLETPEGYMWVSAARKKDIQWGTLRWWARKKGIEQYCELKAGFESGVIPDGYYGNITEGGIVGFGNYLFRKGESLKEYLKRCHLSLDEKYFFRPYGILRDDGWHTHEKFEYKDGKPCLLEKESWTKELYDFIENASGDTVFVVVDNHN